MAMPEQELTPYDQILKLVEQLTPEKEEQLRLALDQKARHEQWRALVNTIAASNKDQTHLSDDEILAEVKAARQAKRTKIAEDSN